MSSFQDMPLISTQARVDGMVEGFLRQATDWRSLASLTCGGLAYRLGRMGGMSVGLGRIASLGMGLGTEVSAFEVTNRSLQNNLNLWKWSGPGGLKEGLLSSFITFAALKAGGFLTQGQNLILQHCTQDLAMATGHQLLYQTGIGPIPEGNFTDQMLHAEATNLQIMGGMALGHGITGGRLYALEKGLDLFSDTADRRVWSPRPGLPSLGGGRSLTKIAALGSGLAAYFGAGDLWAGDGTSDKSSESNSLLVLGGALALSALAAWAAKKWVLPKFRAVPEKPAVYGNAEQAEMAERLADLRAKYIDKKLSGRERRLAFAQYLQWIRLVPKDWQEFLHRERDALYTYFKNTPHNSEGLFFAALKHLNVQLGLDEYVDENVDPPEWEWISLKNAREEEDSPHLSLEGYNSAQRKAISKILTGDAATIQAEEVYYYLEDESIGEDAGPHRFTLKVHIDPDSGQPLAIGRYRRIPKEIQRKTVTIQLRVQALPENLQNFAPDFTVHVADIIVPSFLPTKVKNLWTSFVGHPFEKPKQDNFPEIYKEEEDE